MYCYILYISQYQKKYSASLAGGRIIALSSIVLLPVPHGSTIYVAKRSLFLAEFMFWEMTLLERKYCNGKMPVVALHGIFARVLWWYNYTGKVALVWTTRPPTMPQVTFL